MTVFDKFLKFEFVLGIEPPKTFLYHSVWFLWSERLAGPSWRSKWSSSPILNPRYWPKKLRFASLPRSTPLVFNWSAWKEKPNIRSSSSHVFTNPESTYFHKIFFVLFFYKVEVFYCDTKCWYISLYYKVEKILKVSLDLINPISFSENSNYFWESLLEV